MAKLNSSIIDMHFHVGILGNENPQWGRMSKEYQEDMVFKIFLLFAKLKSSQITDQKLIDSTIEIIKKSKLDKVVCLALDPVYSEEGQRMQNLSDMWVDNEYIIHLRKMLPEKILFGASVHPFDKEFETRVQDCVEKGAVLLKWLPSAQWINLGNPVIAERLKYLATARNGKPLPLLLHCGPEYAVHTKDDYTKSYDFLSWNSWDKVGNFFRYPKQWHTPNIKEIHKNLKYGLDNGSVIIFAHCGLPYFAPNWIKAKLEHSDFNVIKNYIKMYSPEKSKKGKCFADISACSTPIRQTFFNKIKKLPDDSIIFGSDFPTPIFELSPDINEVMEDFNAVLKGDWTRIFVPEDNLLDVNYLNIKNEFGADHKLFRNFNEFVK